MQATAAKIGYSETVFAAPEGDRWRVRYFAPTMEIPFCGHATIALGAALATGRGDGVFPLRLNRGWMSVEGHRAGNLYAAAFQSPPTRSQPAAAATLAEALDLFSCSKDDLDERLPPAFIEAGARHLLLGLRSRATLAAMRYDLEEGAQLMRELGLATISLVHSENSALFHARNPFAAGGVYEDPATGAAAAALAGYLRALHWPHRGVIEIRQGDDMRVPCRLRAEIPLKVGAAVKVSGTVRPI